MTFFSSPFVCPPSLPLFSDKNKKKSNAHVTNFGSSFRFFSTLASQQSTQLSIRCRSSLQRHSASLFLQRALVIKVVQAPEPPLLFISSVSRHDSYFLPISHFLQHASTNTHHIFTARIAQDGFNNTTSILKREGGITLNKNEIRSEFSKAQTLNSPQNHESEYEASLFPVWRVLMPFA